MKEDARIWGSCAYHLPRGTDVRCEVDDGGGSGEVISLRFGDGPTQGEVIVDMPVTLAGVLLSQMKKAVLEIRAKRLAAGGEVSECVPDI